MNIKLTTDQGRSLLDELQSDTREKFVRAPEEESSAIPLARQKDVFERTSTQLPAESATEKSSQNTSSTGAVSEGLNISFQFDLFYELSSKVEAKMGQSGATRFAELSGRVAETFAGSFKLSIDAVGSFMNGTDKSLDISSETAGEFFDAVEGLADLSPEALENFLKESNDFFAELEATYGEADGAFDDIKAQMQEQAKAFFADVEQTRADALSDSDAESSEALAEGSSPQSETDDSQAISMLLDPDKQFSQVDYKEFLNNFIEYTLKFQKQLIAKFLATSSSYGKPQKTSEESADTGNNIIDTAV